MMAAIWGDVAGSMEEAVERGRAQLLFNAATVGHHSSCEVVVSKKVTYGISGTNWSAWNTITAANFSPEEAENKIQFVFLPLRYKPYIC